MIRFISIDSSLANTGVALGKIIDNKIYIDSIHLVSTSKNKNKQVRVASDTIARCRKTYNFVKGLIDNYNPNIIFAETPSGSQNASGMKSYGTTCQLLASLSPPPIEVTPHETKMCSVNDKKASKVTIINWASSKYPDLNWFYHAKKLQLKNEHMADAIAVAYAGIRTQQYLRLENIWKEN